MPLLLFMPIFLSYQQAFVLWMRRGLILTKIQSIFAEHGGSYIREHAVSMRQLRALNAITFCKTSNMGSHVLCCDDCGHEKVVYNSCGNRHCPCCGALNKEKWLHKQQESLLPVHYFHLVFTLPDDLRPLIYCNQRRLYNLMYSAVSDTIKELSAERLGTVPGFSLLLHTWGQTLCFHPHIHCILAGGGLSLDHSHFRSFKKKFFIHVNVLSQRFRKKFMDGLKVLYEENQLYFYGDCKTLRNSYCFKDFVNNLFKKDWVVFSKSVFKSATHVLRYLGNYTHRVAISNHRILSVTKDVVTFRYKDNKDSGKRKTMILTANEFIRRFLLHVLPYKFVKIRHYGFLSNRFRAVRVALCRQLVKKQRGLVLKLDLRPFDPRAVLESMIGKEKITCPICGQYFTYTPHALCVNRS